MSDIWTMLWKEAKDSPLQGGPRALIAPLIFIAIAGIFLPEQLGQNWLALSTATMLLLLLPFMFVSSYVGDTIAGERERHTLETLPASRISDRAILLGKLIAIVGYAWGMVLGSLLFGVVSANLAQRSGRWIFYAPFGLLLEALALSVLTSVLAASEGVLISLRAATARQVQQTMGVSTLVLVVVVLQAARAVPSQVLLSSASNTPQFWFIPLAACAALDALALVGAFVRFQRARLI